MSKLMDFDDAVLLIKDGDSIVITGIISALCPDRFLSHLEKHFFEEGSPRDLQVFTPCRIGWTRGTGIERFAHHGLLKRLLSSSFHVADTPTLAKMIEENSLEVYCFPMGVMYEWLRSTLTSPYGFISQVGLGTFVDPRVHGGRITDCCQEDLVKVIHIQGEEMLHYQPLSFDVAIVYGTTADTSGNISMEDEPLILSQLNAAQAAKGGGGRVIAQVKRVVERGSLDPRSIVVPSPLVDAVVVDPDQRQSLEPFNPYWTGELKQSLEELKRDIPLTLRKVVLRRAALEMKRGDMVNLGVGIPVGLPFLALEEDFLEYITFSTEHGAVGGIPSGVKVFGTHINPEAILDTANNFAMYHGGCLDVSFLGFAEVDRQGNVNVSRFGSSLRGSGGLIDITHTTKKIVFCGTLTSGGLKGEIKDQELTILQDGRHKKFVPEVNHITFHGQRALEKGQEVLYITDRAVFRLVEDGILLEEVAPGVDLQKDILDSIGFPVEMAQEIKVMDAELFCEKPYGLKEFFSNQG